MSSRSYNLEDYERLSGNKIDSFSQAPVLKARVEAGELPRIEERLPDNPLVMVPWEESGHYGGDLNYVEYVIDYDLYLRHLNAAPLLELLPEPGTAISKWINGKLQPGIFEYWEMNPDARDFTFRIRRGLKWSDGVPVTSEDVRFGIDDVVLNEELYGVTEQWARWGDEPVKLEVIDDTTFRLRFAAPYALFLRRLVNWRWRTIMLPAHYLKPFHRKYRSMAELLPLMRAEGYQEGDWGRFFNRVASRVGDSGAFIPTRAYKVFNYPTLDPWVNVRQPNPGDFILERNPYYYKIDPQGRQLPYIDRLVRTFVNDLQVEILKVVSGETDLQFQQLRLSDYPLFKENENKGGYKVALLDAVQDYMLIFPLNLNPEDLVLRDIVQDVRFRRALSLALNREEIKDVLFLGKGRPAQLAPMPGSPWYDESFPRAYADFDVIRANRLLDEMGLKWDAEHRYRLRSDGKRLTLRIDFYQVTPPAAPGAEMARQYWAAIGVEVLVKEVDGRRYWQMRNTNANQVTVWWANGASPIDEVHIGGMLMNYHWHEWNISRGVRGEEPPQWVKTLFANTRLQYSTPSDELRDAIGKETFRLLADKVWSIGTVAETPNPFVYSTRLGNVEVGIERKHYAVTIAEAAEQWYFKD